MVADAENKPLTRLDMVDPQSFTALEMDVGNTYTAVLRAADLAWHIKHTRKWGKPIQVITNPANLTLRSPEEIREVPERGKFILEPA